MISIIVNTYNLKEVERFLCETALKESGGAIVAASKKLGISRHALKRRINRYGLGHLTTNQAKKAEATIPREV